MPKKKGVSDGDLLTLNFRPGVNTVYKPEGETSEAESRGKQTLARISLCGTFSFPIRRFS